MRGRILDDAFVILDEAQNTTHAQNENVPNSFRFWFKMVVTGDQTSNRPATKGVKVA